MPERRESPDYNCPGCGQPAVLSMSEQAWCGNDSDCQVICWNPWERYTAADLATMHRVDLSGLFGPEK